MKFIIEDIIEIIEDFVDNSELSKGLRQAETVKLKAAIDLLQAYESTLPDDILRAIRDILQFTTGLHDGKKREDEDEDEDKDIVVYEKGKIKKQEKAHSWGFSLTPNDDDFEKQNVNRSRKRRKKSGEHNWGFKVTDSDAVKKALEDEIDEIVDNDDDEDIEGDDES